MDDQVVVTGLDRRRGGVRGQQLAHLGDLGVEVPAGAGEVLPAASGWRGDGPHRREPVVADVDGGELGLDPHPLLRRGRPGEAGEVLVLTHVGQHRRCVCDLGGVQQYLVELQDPADLVRLVHREGIDLVVRNPAGVGIDVLVREPHRRRGERPRYPGRGHRTLDQPGRGVGGQRDVGGETPHAIVHDADRQAEHLAIGGGLQRVVAERPKGLLQPLHPDLGVAAAEFLRPGQGRIAELSQGEVEKARIEVWHGGQPIASYGTTAQDPADEAGSGCAAAGHVRRTGPAADRGQRGHQRLARLLGGEGLDPVVTAPHQVRPQPAVEEHLPDAVADLIGSARVDQQGRTSADLGDGGCRRGHHRRAASHRLEWGKAEPLGGGQVDQRLGVGQQDLPLRIADPVQKDDRAPSRTRGGDLLGLAAEPTPPGDDETVACQPWILGLGRPEGLDGQSHVLPGMQLAQVKQVWRPNAPLGQSSPGADGRPGRRVDRQRNDVHGTPRQAEGGDQVRPAELTGSQHRAGGPTW